MFLSKLALVAAFLFVIWAVCKAGADSEYGPNDEFRKD